MYPAQVWIQWTRIYHLGFYKDPATSRGFRRARDDHEVCSSRPRRRTSRHLGGAGAPLATSEMPCRKGRRSAASESCRLRGRRCPPTYCQELGAVHLLAPCWCAPTFLAQVLVRLAGSRPPGRVSLGMESAGRAQPVRSGLALGSGAIRLGWQAGSGSSGTVSAEWEGRNMHTCTHVFRRQLST